MGHDKLANHYKNNFGLMQHHHWSLTEMDSMMPWERYIYLDMLQSFLLEQEKEAKQKEQEFKAQIQSMQRRRK